MNKDIFIIIAEWFTLSPPHKKKYSDRKYGHG